MVSIYYGKHVLGNIHTQFRGNRWESDGLRMLEDLATNPKAGGKKKGSVKLRNSPFEPHRVEITPSTVINRKYLTQLLLEFK